MGVLDNQTKQAFAGLDCLCNQLISAIIPSPTKILVCCKMKSERCRYISWLFLIKQLFLLAVGYGNEATSRQQGVHSSLLLSTEGIFFLYSVIFRLRRDWNMHIHYKRQYPLADNKSHFTNSAILSAPQEVCKGFQLPSETSTVLNFQWNTNIKVRLLPRELGH